MYFTSSSLSYIFLSMSLIGFAFFLYFKSLVIKTTPNNSNRDKIIGTMKDPDTWRYKNSMMANLSIFWAIVSLGVFVYLKFFYKLGLISMIYFFIYLAGEVISIAYFSSIRKLPKKANP